MSNPYKYSAFVEVRSQRSIGSGRYCGKNNNKFGGPDTRVIIQCCPNGVRRLQVLNKKAAEKKGIILIYCGEGYSKNCKTNKSMLYCALSKAGVIATDINKGILDPEGNIPVTRL